MNKTCLLETGIFRRAAIAFLCSLLVMPVLLFSALASRSSHGAIRTPDFTPQRAALIINEYLADPAAGAAGDANGDGASNTTADEFVELVNSGPAPLDISGFTISDALQVRFTVPAGKVIPAGEAAVVFGGGTPTGSFGNAGANGLVFVAGGSGLSLNNAGDTITIKDNTGAVEDSLTYGSSEGNADQSITRSPDITGGLLTHSTAAGSGGSLFSPGRRVNGAPFTSTDPVIASISADSTVAGSGEIPLTITGNNFQETSIVRVDGSQVSTTYQNAMTLDATIPSSVTGAPGPHAVTVENPGAVVSNSVIFTVLGAVGINEYLADPPDGIAGDANGDGTRDASEDEFVEVINRTGLPINIGGYTISDADSVRFGFPSGTTIPAGEVAVIFGGGLPAGDFGNAHANGLVFTAPLSLNNGGDTITLKDGLSNTLESITFGASEGGANQAVNRNPEITGTSFAMHSAMPGSGGRLFSPGTRVSGATFTAPNPIITSIAPDGAVAGSGDVTITVRGNHFGAASRVRVDGSPITTSFQDAMTLNATVPGSATNTPGVRQITVENTGPVISNAVTFTVLATIGINEYLADPPGGAGEDLIGDANNDGVRDSSQDEFVEVINRTGVPVDVSGYSISDADAIRFRFPIGTIIPAGEVAVIFGGGLPTGEFGNARANGLVFTAVLSLNNSGDSLTLRDDLTSTLELITFGSAEGSVDQSINRNPEIAGVHFATHSTVPGNGGRLFSPGTLAGGSPFTVGPRITSINPTSARKDDPPFDLGVFGSGFDAASKLFIDGQQSDTMFISGAELRAHVPGSVLAASGPHQVRVRNEGGNRSNPATLTIIPPPPVLSLLLPKSVVLNSGQFTLFLTGLNYDASSAVFIEGTPVPTSFVNTHELRATVPASFIATLGPRRVVVRNIDGQQSNENAFEVIPAATVLASLQPASAVTGGPALLLTLRGGGFKNDGTALFDRTPLDTTFISQTHLAAQVPASLIANVGIHAITVRNANEQPSNDVIFQVLPDSPVIASLDPTTVIEGSGDVIVTVNGSKFQRGALVRVVEKTRRGAALDTTFISTERLQAKVPSSLVRTAAVVSLGVENPDLGFSSAVALNVLIRDPLVINEYLADPPEGVAGDANGDGTRSSSSDEFIEILNRSERSLDISGYTLSDRDAVRHVFAAGTVLPAFEAAVVFGGGTPSGPFGNAAENHLVFKASSGGLSLNNGGDTINLQDRQGHVVQGIKFGAVEGGASQSINRNPDGDGSTFVFHSIVAENVNRLFSPGTKAAGQTFTVKPAISALSPASVRIGSQRFLIVVSGSKFLPGAVVLLGNTSLPTVFRSDLQLEAQVSADLVADGGAADVRVRNPRGELSGIAPFFIVDDPPRVSGISPQTAGTGAENLEVAVTGERFQRGASVLVQGESVETRFISATSLVAVLPGTLFGRAAELALLVQNADGNRSNASVLSVDNGPLITRLSKKKIRAGQGTIELTVGGVAFKPGIVLFVNDTAVNTTFASQVEFTARMPAEMTSQVGLLMLQARDPNGGRSNTVRVKVVQ